MHPFHHFVSVFSRPKVCSSISPARNKPASHPPHQYPPALMPQESWAHFSCPDSTWTSLEDGVSGGLKLSRLRVLEIIIFVLFHGCCQFFKLFHISSLSFIVSPSLIFSDFHSSGVIQLASLTLDAKVEERSKVGESIAGCVCFGGCYLRLWIRYVDWGWVEGQRGGLGN